MGELKSFPNPGPCHIDKAWIDKIDMSRGGSWLCGSDPTSLAQIGYIYGVSRFKIAYYNTILYCKFIYRKYCAVITFFYFRN